MTSTQPAQPTVVGQFSLPVSSRALSKIAYGASLAASVSSLALEGGYFNPATLAYTGLSVLSIVAHHLSNDSNNHKNFINGAKMNFAVLSTLAFMTPVLGGLLEASNEQILSSRVSVVASSLALNALLTL